MQGLILHGKIVGEETSKPVATKAGGTFQERTLSVSIGKLQNILVSVPLDYKVVKDKEDFVSLPVETVAKQWDNVSKRFGYVQVKFYIPKL